MVKKMTEAETATPIAKAKDKKVAKKKVEKEIQLSLYDIAIGYSNNPNEYPVFAQITCKIYSNNTMVWAKTVKAALVKAAKWIKTH